MITLSEHILLIENRVETLKKKHWDKMVSAIMRYGRMNSVIHLTDDQVFDKIVAIDPTPNKIYLDWLLRLFYLDPRFTLEDSDKIRGDLALYTRIKHLLPIVRQRDINHIDPDDKNDNQGAAYRLYKLVEPYYDHQSNKQAKKDEIADWKKQIEVVYQSGHDAVYIPRTVEASKFLGRGTRWCTAADHDNMFDDYTHLHTPLFVIFKGGNKYQYHSWDPEIGIDQNNSVYNWIHDAQFMDEQDHPAKISREQFLSWPGIKAAMTKYPQYFVAMALQAKFYKMAGQLAGPHRNLIRQEARQEALDLNPRDDEERQIVMELNKIANLI